MTDEDAGLYVAGEGNDEDLDWIPDEMIEADAAEDEAEEVPEGREEVVIGEHCGEVRPQTWRSPVTPSAAEIADHDLTHCPYRSWCPVCVLAMGREDPQPRQGPKEKSEIPEVGMDYDK